MAPKHATTKSTSSKKIWQTQAKVEHVVIIMVEGMMEGVNLPLPLLLPILLPLPLPLSSYRQTFQVELPNLLSYTLASSVAS